MQPLLRCGVGDASNWRRGEGLLRVAVPQHHAGSESGGRGTADDEAGGAGGG